jgi:hypothetical protein
LNSTITDTETGCPSFNAGSNLIFFAEAKEFSLKRWHSEAIKNLTSLTFPDLCKTTKTRAKPESFIHFPSVAGYERLITFAF